MVRVRRQFVKLRNLCGNSEKSNIQEACLPNPPKFDLGLNI